MRAKQTYQGRWTKISDFPKFGTTNSHNIYVAAAVWKVSKNTTHATRSLRKFVSGCSTRCDSSARTGYTTGPYTPRYSSCTTGRHTFRTKHPVDKGVNRRREMSETEGAYVEHDGQNNRAEDETKIHIYDIWGLSVR